MINYVFHTPRNLYPFTDEWRYEFLRLNVHVILEEAA